MKCILLKIAVFFMNVFYFFIKIFPTENKITFISRQSNNITLDFKLLKEEIEKHNKYKVVVLCKKLEGKEEAQINEVIKYVFHSFKQMYHIATSKVVILDSYSVAVSVLKHKKSLKVIQIWHSIGTMKKFGYDILGKEEGSSEKIARVMKMHKNYDVILCSGKGYIDDLARQFNYDKSFIKVIPLPRTDYITDKNNVNKIKKDIYSIYPSLKNKKNILYCPTFRDDEKLLEEKTNELISLVDSSKYNLIIKLHPLSKVNINSKDVVIASEFSSIEMSFVSDYVITDYSCILYEIGLLNKPLYFYCFDYDEYYNNRDLNIDYYNDLPGIKTKDIKEILTSIDHDDYDIKELKKFINKYIDINNEKSCNRIYDLIEEIDK